MKRILPLLCALALVFAACAARPEPEPTTETATQIITATETATTTEPTTTTEITATAAPATAKPTTATSKSTTTTTTTGYAQNRGWAFYQVFLALESGRAKYVALDPAGVPKDSQATLERLMREYCAGTGQTFLLATREELDALGYLKLPEGSNRSDSLKYFADGYLYSFSGGDEAAYAGPLTIQGSKWYAPLAAEGATYTVELRGDVWAIGREERRWIS
jgi:hypothetical protein